MTVSRVRRSRSGRLLQLVGHPLQLHPQVLLALQQVLAVLFLDLLALVLRIELPLDRVDLALHALHRLDLVLDLLDQAALDDLGELDVADAP